MNTIQINKVSTTHVKHFQGVYPIDLLQSALIKPSIIVINLDNHYMPGSHWVAVCISDCGYAKYFDSYGLLPYQFEVMAFLLRHSISWTFKSNKLHGFISNVCGHYCCIYALHRAMGQSMTSIVNIFVPGRYTSKDKKAVHMFRAYIHEYIHAYIHTYIHNYIHIYIHTFTHPIQPENVQCNC